VFALCLEGCSIGYLLHLGKGQIKIVCGSKSIEDVIRDPEVPESVKGKIRLVLDAKSFGEKELGLASSKNYTRYHSVKDPPVAYNLTASPKLLLEAYRWCFPIAGCLPYKGFFDRKRALRESERMSERGYDTHLRPVGAYSTLGWFKDPIFSTMLQYGDTGLVEVILHEMVHRTIFVKHQGAFNEGVATFVGEKGTEAFFRTRGGGSPESFERLRQKREAKRLFQEAMFQMADRLRLLYELDLEEVEKLSRRGQVFEDAKTSLREELERRGTTGYQRILGVDWNNAFLVSYLTYHQDPDLWEAVYDRFDQDLTAMVAWLKQLGGEKDPLSVVQRWLNEGEPAENH
jgi:predicted aminopeptidase